MTSKPYTTGRGTRFYSRLIADNTALGLQAAYHAEREDDLVRIIQEKNRVIEEQQATITQLTDLVLKWSADFAYLYSQAYTACYRSDMA